MSKADQIASIVSESFGGFSFRNSIINPRFKFWQRGVSFAAAAGRSYTADRWARDSVNSTIDVSRQSFTLGQTDVPNEPEFFLRCVVASSAGAGNLAMFTQRIEGVRSLAGKKATLTFYARTTSAPKNIAVEIGQNFGTGGSPSAAVNVTPQTAALTTTFQRFSMTFDIPSISGKTLGSNGDDHLDLRFWMDAGSNYNARTNSLGQQSGTFDFVDVQLEEGEAFTSLERRPHSIELALCQRYYFKTFPPATTPAQNAGIAGAYTFGQFVAGAVNAAYMMNTFPVQMRGTPTMVTYNPSAANTQARNSSTGTDYAASTVSGNAWGWQLTATGPGGGSVGNLSYLHVTADAEL